MTNKRKKVRIKYNYIGAALAYLVQIFIYFKMFYATSPWWKIILIVIVSALGAAGIGWACSEVVEDDK